MIKAIETRYGEHLFRSRLEARYAIFLDAIGEEWIYEPETYDLDGEWYLPDFWLPRMKCFLEIKGPLPNESEVSKCRKLQYHSGHAVILVHGLPNQNDAVWFAWDCGDSGGGIGEYYTKWGMVDGELTLVMRDYKPNRYYFTEEWKSACATTDDWGAMEYVRDAVIQAKEARFEFGQTPSRPYPSIVNYENIPF